MKVFIITPVALGIAVVFKDGTDAGGIKLARDIGKVADVLEDLPVVDCVGTVTGLPKECVSKFDCRAHQKRGTKWRMPQRIAAYH